MHPIFHVILRNDAARRLAQGALWFPTRDVIGRCPALPGIARLFDRRQRFLAMALLSPGSRTCLRVFSRKDEQVDRTFWRARIERAHKRRERLFDLTDAYRVVFGESDGIPSVVIDRYNDICTLQISSAGAECIRSDLIDAIAGLFHPSSIIEKDDTAARCSEGLPAVEEIICGQKPCTQVREGDQRFLVDVLAGQKSGAYLDYRAIRLKAREFAKGRCLDAFCYEGWFSCQIASRAESVIAIDSSQAALQAAKCNALANKHTNIEWLRADVFEHLSGASGPFDFIHLDPPAMAREQARIAQALAGYRKLIRCALAMLRKHGTLLISSCSHKITERLLEEVLLEGLRHSQRAGEILWRGIQDVDHPLLKNHAESLYLKAIAVRVTT